MKSVQSLGNTEEKNFYKILPQRDCTDAVAAKKIEFSADLAMSKLSRRNNVMMVVMAKMMVMTRRRENRRDRNEHK